MASDGSDPPIPPLAKSDKEKGKKKSYMVKLLNRFNNVNASSSQPSTPTSTSTARFVPPPLQVPGLTPTSPSISPSLEVPAFTPRDNPPHSSSAANDFEDVSNNCPIITPIGGGFYPTKTASKAIIATIKQQFDEPWVRWGQIPKTQIDVFFERFKSQELGRSVHVDEIFQQTHIRASTGEFVDERSRRTNEEFQAKFSQIRSETTSVGASACAPLEPADEERLRNQCWLDVAGGRYKGHVYGIGNEVPVYVPVLDIMLRTNLVDGMEYFGSVFVRRSRSHHKCITSCDCSSTYHPDECLLGIVE
ncbi:hypothetical protein LR48_Vigan09g117300 [Vigna angularis]|uniref:Uncharacterized protein n=1 Tax=Phaseolus angularis TaxID=3914 RepID=A0A0L9VCZ3_PHAAN|nr:hypothetical protein LR48_Vigan09g117300 [Vigna angularis]